MNGSWNETYRFGSARWANEHDLAGAGLYKGLGPQPGFWGQRPIHLDSDAPICTIGGAGSGKLRDVLSYTTCLYPGSMLVNDPKGELAAISLHNQVRLGKAAYCINARGLHGLPMHGVNPLDVLDARSPSFHSDCKLVAEMLITLSGASNAEYFELRAREYVEGNLKDETEKRGAVSLTGLYERLCLMESDPLYWEKTIGGMIASPFADVARIASEMLNKRISAPKEASAIIGEIFKCLSFMSDPALQRCLGPAPDFSLKVLCNPQQSSNIYLIIPAEYIGIWGPFMRLVIGVAMLYKARHPQSPRVLFLIDEAAQLGRFEGLLRAFTYGRGAGIRAWAVFQDIGQIARNFGHTAVQGFLGSAQVRQFLGVRDYETAELVSRMLGSQTLEWDDMLQQTAARHAKRRALQAALLGGAQQEFSTLDASYHGWRAQQRSKQQRLLMTPDEILNMPEDRQILFISGLNCPPIYANKYPYYTQRRMAGMYLPNPYHPPMDRVRIATMFGSAWRRVITRGVPRHLAHWPQFQDGKISYVEGFRPF